MDGLQFVTTYTYTYIHVFCTMWSTNVSYRISNDLFFCIKIINQIIYSVECEYKMSICWWHLNTEKPQGIKIDDAIIIIFDGIKFNCTRTITSAETGKIFEIQSKLCRSIRIKEQNSWDLDLEATRPVVIPTAQPNPYHNFAMAAPQTFASFIHCNTILFPLSFIPGIPGIAGKPDLKLFFTKQSKLSKKKHCTKSIMWFGKQVNRTEARYASYLFQRWIFK